MRLIPFLVNPVMIDSTSTTSEGFIVGESGGDGQSLLSAPILYNGNLYTIMQVAKNATGEPINVYQSTNKGVSWSILDSAHAPTKQDQTPTAGMYFDGDHTLILAWLPLGGPIVGSVGHINLKNFDLSTGLWGATYGTTSPPAVWEVNQVLQRPDGSIMVLAAPTNSGGSIINLSAYIYSGGGWSTSFAVDTNMNGTFRSNGGAGVVMEPSTGNVHVFGIAQDPSAGFKSEIWYQLVRSDNSLGTFAVIQTGSPFNLPGVSGNMEPCISGNNVIVGIVDDTAAFVTLSIGTPLSAPVFTRIASPGIDPVLPTAFFRLFAPQLAADSTGIYAVYFIQRHSDSSIYARLCGNPNVSTPATGWSFAITAWDALLASPSLDPTLWQFPNIVRQGGNLFGTAQGALLTDGPVQPTQFWFGAFARAIGNQFRD